MGRGSLRIAALAGAMALVACSSGEEPSSGASGTTGSPEPAPTSTLGPVDAVEAEIAVGGQPIGVATGEGSVWVVNSEFESGDPGSVTRIDPGGGEVLATVEVGAVPLEVAVGEGAVWVSNAEDDTVSRIDPTTDEVVATIAVCAAPEGIAIGDGSVWVVCEEDNAVGRIDPERDEMVETIDVGLQPRFATFAFDSLWVSNYLDGGVMRIDPKTGKILAEVEVGQGPQIMIEAAGSLWVSCTDVDAVQRIDPQTNEVVAEVPTPIAPDGLAFDGTFIVWVATEVGPELAGIDVATNEVVATGRVAEEGAINANQVMVFEGGTLWLPILGRGAVLRVTPLATIVD
ncbi:MAG: hypothetical protein ACRDHU_06465 [Actinomycetota bacterium]